MNRTQAEYRAARAVELSLAGWTYDQIAGQLGFRDRSGAWRAARRCLQRRQLAAADRYLAGALVDLDIVQERAWGRAVAGDLQAARVVLRVIEDRVRLVEIMSTQGSQRSEAAAPTPVRNRDLVREPEAGHFSSLLVQ